MRSYENVCVYTVQLFISIFRRHYNVKALEKFRTWGRSKCFMLFCAFTRLELKSCLSVHNVWRVVLKVNTIPFLILKYSVRIPFTHIARIKNSFQSKLEAVIKSILYYTSHDRIVFLSERHKKYFFRNVESY